MEQQILEKITQVKDIHIKDLVPNTIDGVVIQVIDNRRQISLPLTMNGEKFVTWKKKRGGIFYKDLFNWIKGEPYGKYIKASGEDVLLILRIIDDEDLELFQLKKLVHGKIKDQNVMILRNLSENDILEEEPEYIKESGLDNTKETENDDPMISEIVNIPLEDEEANSGRSISLFD
jgi:hypothetical protein